MATAYLKKFQAQAQALALDAANDALDRLMNALDELDRDTIADTVYSVKAELKALLQKGSAAPPAPEAPTKKAKKVKDPKAPKGALTAFMFYSNEVRKEVQESDSSLKMTDIAKKIGEMWKALSDEEKKPYLAKAAADKARFEKEKASYNA